MPLRSLSQKSIRTIQTVFEWLRMRVPFSCFLWGFYRADDPIVITLIVHSCLSCNDDCYQGGLQALIRQSMPSSQRGLGNHTKQELLTGTIC